MIQINPDEILPIIRQLADPTDSNTYYVRAFIRKHKGSGESLIATVNLTDKGDQRFTYFYQTPGDSDPYHLSVVTKVYTDSGYTTLSARYTMDALDYLVSERWGLHYGNGGGVEVDYNKIAKMIKKEVGGIAKPQMAKEINLRPILEAIRSNERQIKSIVIPGQKEVIFDPIITQLRKLEEKITQIPDPLEPEKLDLSPAITEIKNTEAAIKDELTNLIKTFDDSQRKGFADILETLKKDQSQKKSIGAIKKILEGEEVEEDKPIKKRKWL